MEADASDALSVELMTRKVCLWNDVDVKGIEKTLSTAEIAGRINYVERERDVVHKLKRLCSTRMCGAVATCTFRTETWLFPHLNRAPSKEAESDQRQARAEAEDLQSEHEPTLPSSLFPAASVHTALPPSGWSGFPRCRPARLHVHYSQILS